MPSEVDLNQKLQKTVDEDRVKYNLPALSVSIRVPNKKYNLNFVSGCKSLSASQKITPNTLFQVGSITKTFTAALVLKLSENGQLSLNDTLGQWLPQYPKWHAITIRELLNHTSGVYNYIDAKGFWQELKQQPNYQWQLSQLADLAYQYHDYFEAGKGYQYTNTDYILLGLVLEKITKKSLTTLYKDNLFAGLHYTIYAPYCYSQTLMEKIAQGYDDEGTFGYGVDVSNVNTSFAASAGAILSTPNDVVTFLKQLFEGHILSKRSLALMMQLVSIKTGKVLDNQDIAAMITNKEWEDIGEGFGLGLVHIKDYGFVWMHAGGMPGYQSMYSYNPKKKIILALAYNKQPKQNFIFMKIANDLYQVLDSENQLSAPGCPG